MAGEKSKGESCLRPCENDVCAVYAKSFQSSVSNSATPWTSASQASLSMGFSRQEYWSGWPCPPLGDLPDPGIEPTPLMSLALAGGFYTTSNTDVKFKFHFLSVKFYCNKAIPIH